MPLGKPKGPRRDKRVNRDPLRAVVGYRTMVPPGAPASRTSLLHEVYECGHVALPKSDAVGETAASRRRCHACAMGKPPHLSTAELTSVDD